MSFKLLAASALFALALYLPSDANAAFTDQYTLGHADVRIEYDDGFDIFLRVEGGTVNGVPNTDVDLNLDSTLVLTDASIARPNLGGIFAPLGVDVGGQVWWLPQTATSSNSFGVPFIGWNSAASGIFENDQVVLSLESVASPSGDGVYSFWQSGFTPNFLMASYDGVDGSDSFVMPLGHDHYNMGFANPDGNHALEEGLWTITYGIAGELLNNGGQVSDQFSVNYWVGTTPVPEPASVLMFGIAFGAFVAVCRRANRARAIARAD